MKSVYKFMLVAGLFMNSADFMYSSDQSTPTIVMQMIAIVGVPYVFYKVGSYSRVNSQILENKFVEDSHMDMDLVAARMKLKKTGLDTRSDLAMPRLDLTPEAKEELRQAAAQKKVIQDEVAKYYRHHSIKK